MFSALKNLFGSQNEKIIKKLRKEVELINALEPDMEKLSDPELKNKTAKFKKRLAAGESLEDIKHEAFALVREASKRTLGLRHFDVQLIGGLVLHGGAIAEMRTGEGKTLVATLPLYLNALTGKGAHLVTVNDYLVARDGAWMGKIYEFLGLSVGIVTSGVEDSERKKAYAADITFAANNELGFDYLRDNMKYDSESKVQRPPNFAVVDEKEIDKEYDNLTKFLQGTNELKVSHILVATEKEAKDIEEQLKKDAKKFASLAKKYSKDEGTKVKGGNLGYVTKGQLVPEFEKAANDLKTGEISKPVQTQFGWHIIKLDDKRPATIPSKKDATASLTAKIKNGIINEYINSLEEKYSVKITLPNKESK